MDDSLQTEQTIIVDGKVNLEDYKIYWRDLYARQLPNTLIFYGILSVGALFFAFLFRESLLGFSFFLFVGFIACVPILLSIYNYFSFIKETKKYIASLSEQERCFNMIVKPGGKGIEFMQGESYSLLAWESIRSVVEKENYFSLEFRTTPFLIMKNEFKDEADLGLFRNTLADRFGKQAKLLR